MPRLVVQPGTPQAWEIQLKQGINFLGRGVSNDFKFDDASVSGAHCQITVENGSATIRDTGSTNGTFVNRSRVHESRLVTGQPVRLGSVDMIFYADEVPVAKAIPSGPASAPPPLAPAPNASTAPGAIPSAPLPIAKAIATPSPSAPPVAPALKVSAVPVAVSIPAPAPKISDAPPAPAPAPALKISGLTHAPAAAAVAVLEAPPITDGLDVPAHNVALDVGARFCKFHPKSAARYLCKKCDRSYCEVCVTTLNVGGKSKFTCKNCGLECVPLQVRLANPDAPRNFFASVPGAFSYPFRGSGIFILLVGMIIFAGIRLGTLMMSTGSPRGIGMGIILQMVLSGYLFTLLQNIIHSTASGDTEVPELGGINFLEDVLLPFFRLLGLVLVSFAPAIALTVVTLTTASPIAGVSIFPALLFGCAYFPMAFLAVAILDSVGAVNPLVIIPSILKVPLEYAVTVTVLTVVLAFTEAGDIAIKHLFPKGLMTESVGELVGMFALKFLLSLIAVYLLFVKTRILGLLYLSKKNELGWIGR